MTEPLQYEVTFSRFRVVLTEAVMQALGYLRNMPLDEALSDELPETCVDLFRVEEETVRQVLREQGRWREHELEDPAENIKKLTVLAVLQASANHPKP